ncbi:MAG: O-antigen ligase family protein [Acinetobacter towneri]|nr:O-antigen ligase family protein [Acinetobacter towneri]
MHNIISKLLLCSIPIFCFIAFSSMSLYWAKAPYDAWRIYEIIILLIINLLSIGIILKNNIQILDHKHNKIITYLIIILISFIIYSAWHAEYSSRAFADASLYILLFSGCLLYTKLIKHNKEFSENIAASVAILPILTLIFLPIAIWDRLNGGIGVWTQSFTNIRMLDDALLPCLFLIWLRPGFLKKNVYHTQIKSWLLTLLVFSISTIYLLSFLFHGARACILGITIGIIFSLFYIDKSKLHLLKLPSLSILTAIFLYWLYHLQLPKYIGSALTRTSTSGRAELWLKAWQVWLEHPFFGVGGNHFFLQEPYSLLMHPHNLLFKFLSEWGIATFLFLILFFFITKKIKQNIQIIPFFLLSGSIAILINSLLSGSMLYPVSQITNMFLIAYTLQFIAIPTTSVHKQHNLHSYIWIAIIFFASFTMLYIHFQDMTCINCISIDFEGAPGFWDSGRPLHLEPYVIENLGKPTDKY